VTCTGHSYIEFTIDEVSVFEKGIICKEIELIGMLDGESVDNGVALASLISFNGVYGDVAEWCGIGEMVGEEMADGCYLIAIRHNDA